MTALELKTGREQPSHRGQLLLYALLITERFQNANPQNILLYLNTYNKPKTYYISIVRQELCLLIQRRNELAKLEKTENKRRVLNPKFENNWSH